MNKRLSYCTLVFSPSLDLGNLSFMLFVSTSVTNECLNSSTNNTTIDVKLIFFIVDSLVIVANSQIQLIKPESDG